MIKQSNRKAMAALQQKKDFEKENTANLNYHQTEANIQPQRCSARKNKGNWNKYQDVCDYSPLVKHKKVETNAETNNKKETIKKVPPEKKKIVKRKLQKNDKNSKDLDSNNPSLNKDLLNGVVDKTKSGTDKIADIETDKINTTSASKQETTSDLTTDLNDDDIVKNAEIDHSGDLEINSQHYNKEDENSQTQEDKSVETVKIIKSVRKVKKPNKRMAGQPKSWKCTQCGKVLCSSTSLALHMYRHTGVKPNVCKVCGRGFSMKAYLTSHMLAHTGELTLKCPVCGKMFKRRSALDVHKQIHTDGKTYSCEKCKKMFKTKNSRDVHMYTHYKDKVFTCHVCGKSFGCKVYLRQHVDNIHEGKKPHQCEECGKTFPFKQSYNEHKQRHAGAKLVHCAKCSRKFFNKRELKKHMRFHTEVTDFKCEECNMYFKRMKSLAYHNNIMHSYRYYCVYCKESYDSQKLLKNHLSTVHKDLVKKPKTERKDLANFKKALCDLCGKTLSNKYRLFKHLMSRHKMDKKEIQSLKKLKQFDGCEGALENEVFTAVRDVVPDENGVVREEPGLAIENMPEKIMVDGVEYVFVESVGESAESALNQHQGILINKKLDVAQNISQNVSLMNQYQEPIEKVIYKIEKHEQESLANVRQTVEGEVAISISESQSESEEIVMETAHETVQNDTMKLEHNYDTNNCQLSDLHNLKLNKSATLVKTDNKPAKQFIQFGENVEYEYMCLDNNEASSIQIEPYGERLLEHESSYIDIAEEVIIPQENHVTILAEDGSSEKYKLIIQNLPVVAAEAKMCYTQADINNKIDQSAEENHLEPDQGLTVKNICLNKHESFETAEMIDTHLTKYANKTSSNINCFENNQNPSTGVLETHMKTLSGGIENEKVKMIVYQLQGSNNIQSEDIQKILGAQCADLKTSIESTEHTVGSSKLQTTTATFSNPDLERSINSVREMKEIGTSKYEFPDKSALETTDSQDLRLQNIFPKASSKDDLLRFENDIKARISQFAECDEYDGFLDRMIETLQSTKERNVEKQTFKPHNE